MEFYYDYFNDNLEILLQKMHKKIEYIDYTIEYLDDIVSQANIWKTGKKIQVMKCNNYDNFGPFDEFIKILENMKFNTNIELFSYISKMIDEVSSSQDENSNAIYFEQDYFKNYRSKMVGLSNHINYVIIESKYGIHFEHYKTFPNNVKKIIIINSIRGIFHYDNDIFEYYYPKKDFKKFLDYEIIYKKNFDKKFGWGGIYLSYITDEMDNKYIKLFSMCKQNTLSELYVNNIYDKMKPLLYILFNNNHIKSGCEFIKNMTKTDYYEQKELKIHKIVSNEQLFFHLTEILDDKLNKILVYNFINNNKKDDEFSYNPIYQVINYRINSKDYIKNSYDLSYIAIFINQMDPEIINSTTKIFDYLNVDIFNINHYKMINYIIDNFPEKTYLGSINTKQDLEIAKTLFELPTNNTYIINDQDIYLKNDQLLFLKKIYQIFYN